MSMTTKDLAREAEAAIALLLARTTLSLWSADRQALEAALRVVRTLS